MNKTMNFQAVEGCILLVHNNCAPDDEEFLDYISFCNKVGESLSPSTPFGALAFTDGSGPTPKQRALLQQQLVGRAVNSPTAILTLSPMVRGIVTALTWAGRPVAAFRPMEVSKAFEYLNAPSPARRPAALQSLLEMRAAMVGYGKSIEDEEVRRALLQEKISVLRESVGQRR